jgi:hypothetical protein
MSYVPFGGPDVVADDPGRATPAMLPDLAGDSPMDRNADGFPRCAEGDRCTDDEP